MNSKVINTFKKHKMLKDTKVVIIGVSGGADSMALLNFFFNIKEKYNIHIIVCHINHKLRGMESQRDEKFVCNYCYERNIKLYVFRRNIIKESQDQKLSIEECARRVRYKIFDDLAQKYNAKIATAHTLSDSIETTIFNMIRGTGLKGVSGIPAIRGNIIRPFIYICRNEIEQYCKQNHVPYLMDSSNLNRDYTRNKIRLDIIPQIKKINPSYENSMLRLKNQVECENSYLDDIAEARLRESILDNGFNLELISKLDYCIKTRVILKLVKKEVNINLEQVHINLICKIIDEGYGTLTLPSCVYLKVKDNILRFIKNNDKLITSGWERKFNFGKISTKQGRNFIIKIVGINEYNNICKFDKKLFYKSLDYAIINGSVIFRNRRIGDKFSQKNRGNTKTLKKLFNENKIFVEVRQDILILSKKNEILWIEGIGPSEKSAVCENTKRVIIIQEKNIND